LKLMKEGDRGEGDASERRRPKIIQTPREDWKERQHMALCVHQLTTAWDVWGGSVTVYVYVWSYIYFTFLSMDTTIYLYRKKKVSDIPVHSRDVTYQTLSGREKFNYSRPRRVHGKCMTSRLGMGVLVTFFTVKKRDHLKPPPIKM
jgi:hypothetical protein